MKLNLLTCSLPRSIRPLVLVVSAMALLLSPMPAAAQLSRVGNTVPVFAATTSGTYTAYDPVNDLYLIVQGYGAVLGTFVNSAGQPVTPTFTIHSFADGVTWGLTPALAYSPDVSNGVGGQGGFLVTWHNGINAPTSIYGAIVAFEAPGYLVTAPMSISGPPDAYGSNWLSWPVVAYSKTSQQFLVTWSTRDWGIKGRFAGLDGAPIGPVILFENPSSCRDPSIVWNSATNEFGLMYSAWNNVTAFVGFRKIGIDGTVGGRTSFGFSVGSFATSIVVNSANDYVLAWGLQPGTVTTVFDQNGVQIAPDTLATTRLGGDSTLSTAYSSTTDTILTVSSDFSSWEIAALELDHGGVPIGAVMVATDGGIPNSGSYYPKTTTRTNSNEWDISYSRNFKESANQIIASGGGGTPVCAVIATATVPAYAYLGDNVPFRSTVSATGCGTATPTFSWNFGDGSPAGSTQTVTHAYGSPGRFGWSLTVQVGTVTATRSGNVNILLPGMCIPSTATVSAKPVTTTLAGMWQNTLIGITAGQSVTFSVAGAQTWFSGALSYTAAGNPADPTIGNNSPLPGAPRMALVGRIGTTGVPFLIGTSLVYTATTSGQLYLAPNDDWYAISDNAGGLAVGVCIGGTACSVAVTTTVPTSGSAGSPVAFAATGTPSGCGSATPTYSWNFGDSSPTDTTQNPSHTYAAAGTYTWTLTVQAGTATATSTGSITVSAAGACIPTTTAVLAQPSPATLAGMWQGTGVTVTTGQLVTVGVSGTQTWISGGQSYTAGGNPSDPTVGANSPMPGAPRMALVGRIGTAGAPFLVGTFVQVTAGASGQLYLAPNDDWYAISDNSGSLSASACTGGSACAVTATATVPATAAPGDLVAFAATCSPTGCGTATPTYSWDFGDGSPASSVQNPSHTYATSGTYTWTLTVVVATATATRTGTIDIHVPPPCTPSTSIVLALPSPQTLAGMWQPSSASITSGQTVTITVAGTQTWINAGQSYTAAGNPSDVTSGGNSPMPGAPRMALVGRIGATGAPFLVGVSTQFTASASGVLYLAPNDDWYQLWDNSGSLSVSVCVGSGGTCSVGATATVPTTATVGTPVPFAATGTPSGCGSATPTYSWDFGDGSPVSTAQNPTHTYTATGPYTWTLTVQAGTATATKTGTITVGTAPTCTPSTSAVLAKPTSQTLAGMWQATPATVTAGQSVTITVAGTQTWVNAGQAYTAAGNPSDVTAGGNVPMPGAPRMALVGRIGATGAPFLVGASLQITAQATGLLYLAPNDDWYQLWDNSGSLSVSICVGTPTCSVGATATVPTTATVGVPVSFAATGTTSGCGAATPAYSWDFGDGSPVSTAQNPTHAYAAVGPYTWTLTVQVGTATDTRTGTITVGTAPTCTTTTTVVAAKPTSQTLAGMWQGTGVPVASGDAVTITVSGSQTWTKGGQAWTAAGNPADLTVGSNSPMPGAPRMALVGRLGPAGPSFLVGPSLQFNAQATGQLFLAPNDDWYMLWNNSGSLTVTICR